MKEFIQLLESVIVQACHHTCILQASILPAGQSGCPVYSTFVGELDNPLGGGLRSLVHLIRAGFILHVRYVHV